MKFGSWSSHGLDVNVSERIPAGDISMFVANGEWEIIGKWTYSVNSPFELTHSFMGREILFQQNSKYNLFFKY